MTYPKWVSQEYGIGPILCLNEDEEAAVHAAVAARAKAAAGEEGAEADEPTIEEVRAKLDAAGIPYKKTLGLAKLIALLPAE